jgi:hypothetical protein
MLAHQGSATPKQGVIISDPTPTQIPLAPTMLGFLLKCVVTLVSFAKSQRRVELVQQQMQVAFERMSEIERQIQEQNAFVWGFMSGIVATLIVLAALALMAVVAMMIWMIAHWH